MASGHFDGDESDSIRRRWGDGSNAYTRKSKGKRTGDGAGAGVTAPASATAFELAVVAQDANKDNEKPHLPISDGQEPVSETLADEDGKSLQQEQEQPLETLPPPSAREEESTAEEGNRLEQAEGASHGETAGADNLEELPGSIVPVLPPQPSGNEAREVDGGVGQQEGEQLELELRPPVITRIEDRVRINVSGAQSKDELGDVQRKIEGELYQVRTLYKKLEAKELQIVSFNNNARMVNNSSYSGFGAGVGNSVSYGQPPYMANEVVDRRVLMRANSEMGTVGYQETRPFNRSLSVSVVENDRGVGDFSEREKRTPKANQFYNNSEFLLGKDRLPPESNKKSKVNNGSGRKHGGEVARGFGFNFEKQRERAFKSCSSLLQKLMKHTHAWVFSEPVDAKKLGLHDYHDIIKHPMDLGTIKTRLSRNIYRSPIEFAEDVRLVFHNAMTYNPPGQDVHIMADTMSQIFEEKWAVIEVEYNYSPDWRHQMYHDTGLPAPTSRTAPPTQFYSAPPRSPPLVPTPISAPIPAFVQNPATVTPVPQMRTLDRSASNATPIDPRLNPPIFSHAGRTPAPKKPKAKDPNKRKMTYDEKQKLSTKLQELPPEKLDNIVQIIKKRNSTLSQHDDEIEIDIDSVDTETLWELDRFVTNYKKNLSKHKKRAEAHQVRAETQQLRPATAPIIPVTNAAPVVVETQKESRILDESKSPPRVQTENPGNNASRSSSSSSSSSSSGSSSSDSDSDSSSSSDGSDAEH